MDPNNRILTICADIDKFFREYSKVSSEGVPEESDSIRFHAMSMVLF